MDNVVEALAKAIANLLTLPVSAEASDYIVDMLEVVGTVTSSPEEVETSPSTVEIAEVEEEGVSAPLRRTHASCEVRKQEGPRMYKTAERGTPEPPRARPEEEDADSTASTQFTFLDERSSTPSESSAETEWAKLREEWKEATDDLMDARRALEDQLARMRRFLDRSVEPGRAAYMESGIREAVLDQRAVFRAWDSEFEKRAQHRREERQRDEKERKAVDEAKKRAEVLENLAKRHEEARQERLRRDKERLRREEGKARQEAQKEAATTAATRSEALVAEIKASKNRQQGEAQE